MNQIRILSILVTVLGTLINPSGTLYAQKKAKPDQSKVRKVAAEPFRGFSTVLRFTDSHGEQVGMPVKFGVHRDATYCVDSKLGESFMPPPPPTGIPDIRFVDPRRGESCMDLGISDDFRPFKSPSQIDTYKVSVQGNSGGYPLTLSWTALEKYYKGPVTLTDLFGGRILKVDMKKIRKASIQEELTSIIIIAQKPIIPSNVK